MEGREVVIVEAARTPVGRGHPEKGYYRDVHANTLLGSCYRAVVERAGIDPLVIGDVIGGCVQQYGEQSWSIARNAWLQEGLPFEVPATTIDRQCGSAQQAVNFAASLIASGINDVAIGGGVEHLGHVPMFAGRKWYDEVGDPWPQELLDRYQLVDQGLSAEMIADRWEIPRSDLDEIALRSHQNAARATDEGRFDREIVPFGAITADEGPREPNWDKIRSLPALIPGGRLTAALASQISDAASAMLVVSERALSTYGFTPRARVHHLSVRGADPIYMLTAPIPATAYALEKSGMSLDDIDLIEINEAFASVVLAWQKETGADLAKVNVNGGAIALGHPLGATGIRLMTTLLHELERTGGRYGLQTMCEGGGQANVTIIERL
jgi:acetyl-CoA acetyltransferase family protein